MSTLQRTHIWQWQHTVIKNRMKDLQTSSFNKLKKNVSMDKGAHAEFRAVSAPKIDFSSILETFKDSLSQEQEVTRRFYNLSEIARQDKDYATISFLNWFLDEQVEEEAMFETHINYLTRIGDDSNALYLYEKELGTRTFDEE